MTEFGLWTHFPANEVGQHENLWVTAEYGLIQVWVITEATVVPRVPKDFFSACGNPKAAGEGGPEKKKDFKRRYTPYPSDSKEPVYKIRAPIQE